MRVRVVQSYEPAHFVALFKGRMLVRDDPTLHSGGGRDEGAGVALFQVKGSDGQAVQAVQVRPHHSSLNSRGCFVLQRPGGLTVWRGGGVSAEEGGRAEGVGRALAARLAEASRLAAGVGVAQLAGDDLEVVEEMEVVGAGGGTGGGGGGDARVCAARRRDACRRSRRQAGRLHAYW
ncbi:MAG: hypothetical protein SGPRY_012674 [Prymnesium sp.]